MVLIYQNVERTTANIQKNAAHVHAKNSCRRRSYERPSGAGLFDRRECLYYGKVFYDKRFQNIIVASLLDRLCYGVIGLRADQAAAARKGDGRWGDRAGQYFKAVHRPVPARGYRAGDICPGVILGTRCPVRANEGCRQYARRLRGRNKERPRISQPWRPRRDDTDRL